MADPGVWYGATGYLAFLSTLAFIASLTVGLRFWSRRLVKSRFYTDDWLILCALILVHSSLGLSFTIFLNGHFGLDAHLILDSDPAAIDTIALIASVGGIIYGISSTITRMSVLFFYWRLFPTKTVRRGCIILGVTCILWAVCVEIVTVTVCYPVYGSSHCFPTTVNYVVSGALNTAIDAATVVLPIRDVLQLHVSKKKKYTIVGIFLMGGISTLAALVRLVGSILTMTKHGDNFTGPLSALLFVAFVVEVHMGIIGACAPTLAPVYKKLRYGTASTCYSKGNQPFAYREVAEISPRSPGHVHREQNDDRPFTRLQEDKRNFVATIEHPISPVYNANWNHSVSSIAK